MTNESQTLVDAVEAGEMTDAGGMTTTQDVADVVPYSYDSVDEMLHDLEHEGLVESTTFCNDSVWTVPDNGDDSTDETTTQTIPTATRSPVEL